MDAATERQLIRMHRRSHPNWRTADMAHSILASWGGQTRFGDWSHWAEHWDGSPMTIEGTWFDERNDRPSLRTDRKPTCWEIWYRDDEGCGEHPLCLFFSREEAEGALRVVSTLRGARRVK